jgi:RIO-like serine/threonine protein kinase
MQVLAILYHRHDLSFSDFFKIAKRGNGLSATFIVGKRVVIKIANEMASVGNRKIYNGCFDGLFFYSEDRERLQNEFEFYTLLSGQGLTAEPVCLLRNAIVTRYIESIPLDSQDLSPALLAGVFNLIDKIHSADVFHGDFNLANFLLHDNRLFIIDFESSRFADAENRKDLFALDLVIFIEKFHRFHKTAFLRIARDIRRELEKRKDNYDHVVHFSRKYLPDQVYTAIFE